MMDSRDDCRWYGGDCGDGKNCSDECFEAFAPQDPNKNKEDYMNPLEVTKFLIEMKHDAVRQIQQKVKTSKISDVRIESIGVTPSDNMSEIDEEIILDMELSMYIEGINDNEIAELNRTGRMELVTINEFSFDITYTTSYNYESENGTSCESDFSGTG